MPGMKARSSNRLVTVVVWTLLAGTAVGAGAQAGAQESLGLPEAMWLDDQGGEALELQPLAAAGDSDAQFALAVIYYTGRGVDRDETEALEWFRAAADGGLARARFNLGVMREEGIMMGRNLALAHDHYLEAAAQDFTLAQFNLALLYDSGRGVERNLAEAARWYERAAQGGHAAAQYNIGVMYEHGEGIGRDLVQAHAWFEIAARLLPAKLQKRAERARRHVARAMTEEQVGGARRLAAAWRPR